MWQIFKKSSLKENKEGLVKRAAETPEGEAASDLAFLTDTFNFALASPEEVDAEPELINFEKSLGSDQTLSPAERHRAVNQALAARFDQAWRLIIALGSEDRFFGPEFSDTLGTTYTKKDGETDRSVQDKEIELAKEIRPQLATMFSWSPRIMQKIDKYLMVKKSPGEFDTAVVWHPSLINLTNYLINAQVLSDGVAHILKNDTLTDVTSRPDVVPTPISNIRQQKILQEEKFGPEAPAFANLKSEEEYSTMLKDIDEGLKKFNTAGNSAPVQAQVKTWLSRQADDSLGTGNEPGIELTESDQEEQALKDFFSKIEQHYPDGKAPEMPQAPVVHDPLILAENYIRENWYVHGTNRKENAIYKVIKEFGLDKLEAETCWEVVNLEINARAKVEEGLAKESGIFKTVYKVKQGQEVNDPTYGKGFVTSTKNIEDGFVAVAFGPALTIEFYDAEKIAEPETFALQAFNCPMDSALITAESCLEGNAGSGACNYLIFDEDKPSCKFKESCECKKHEGEEAQLAKAIEMDKQEEMNENIKEKLIASLKAASFQDHDFFKIRAYSPVVESGIVHKKNSDHYGKVLEKHADSSISVAWHNGQTTTVWSSEIDAVDSETVVNLKAAQVI